MDNKTFASPESVNQWLDDGTRLLEENPDMPSVDSVKAGWFIRIGQKDGVVSYRLIEWPGHVDAAVIGSAKEREAFVKAVVEHLS